MGPGTEHTRPGEGPRSDDADRSATIFDYLARARSARVLVSERDEVEIAGSNLAEQVQRSYDEAAARHERMVLPPVELFADWDAMALRLAQATHLTQLGLDAGDDNAGVVHVRCQPTVEMNGRVPDWVAEIRKLRDAGDTTLFVAATPGRAERTIELLKEYDVFAVPVDRADDARYAAVLVAIGRLSRGFRLPDASLQIYTEADVFEEDRRAPERRRAATKAFLSDLRDLKIGDLVVHVDHGIGVFVGLKQIGLGEATQEFLELRYAADDKLFVPVERLDLVQKFTGATRPPVDRLGGTTWERAKTKVKKAMRDMAEELLKLYAAQARRYRATPSAAIRTGSTSSRTPSSTISPRIRQRPSPTSSATWNRRRPWIACCAVTSATGRPRSRCARRSTDVDQSKVWPAGTCLGIDPSTNQPTDIPVDCAAPHAMEVTGAVNLAEKYPDALPPEPEQDTFIKDACTRMTDAYLAPIELRSTTLTLIYSTISLPSWSAGSHQVSCSIGATLGNGGWSTLLNSAKGPLMINGQPPVAPPEIPEERLNLPPIPVPDEPVDTSSQITNNQSSDSSDSGSSSGQQTQHMPQQSTGGATARSTAPTSTPPTQGNTFLNGPPPPPPAEPVAPPPADPLAPPPSQLRRCFRRRPSRPHRRRPNPRRRLLRRPPPPGP